MKTMTAEQELKAAKADILKKSTPEIAEAVDDYNRKIFSLCMAENVPRWTKFTSKDVKTVEGAFLFGESLLLLDKAHKLLEKFQSKM